jgi:hypothetical protein
MMKPESPDRSNDPPFDELAPQLRRAVEEITADQPPEELSRRMVDRLQRETPPTVYRMTRRTIVSVGWAVAACLLIAVTLWYLRAGDSVPQETAAVAPPGTIDQPTVASFRPTWWTYRQAAGHSQRELESLLERHAGLITLSSSESIRLGIPPSSQQETL